MNLIVNWNAYILFHNFLTVYRVMTYFTGTLTYTEGTLWCDFVLSVMTYFVESLFLSLMTYFAGTTLYSTSPSNKSRRSSTLLAFWTL